MLKRALAIMLGAAACASIGTLTPTAQTARVLDAQDQPDAAVALRAAFLTVGIEP